MHVVCTEFEKLEEKNVFLPFYLP